MFTLVAVVCQQALCISWAVPEVFISAEDCRSNFGKLHQIVEASDVYEVKELGCYQWPSDV